LKTEDNLELESADLICNYNNMSTSPFCTVCKSSGKSEEVYTSHFVKDKPNGTVVCPTLLGQECNYCHEKGHTPKHCPKLAAKDLRRKQKGPFCNVCHNAGKPEEVYTSHFVKDKPNGVVVCPTLLNQKCRYCHEKGHTPKHCPRLAAKRDHERSVRPATYYRSAQQEQPMSANQRLQVEKARLAANGCIASAATTPLQGMMEALGSSDSEARFDTWWNAMSEAAKADAACAAAAASRRQRESFMPHPWASVASDAAAFAGRIEQAKMASLDPNSEEQVHLRLFPQSAYTPEEEALALLALEEEAEFQRDQDSWDAKGCLMRKSCPSASSSSDESIPELIGASSSSDEAPKPCILRLLQGEVPLRELPLRRQYACVAPKQDKVVLIDERVAAELLKEVAALPRPRLARHHTCHATSSSDEEPSVPAPALQRQHTCKK